ncbi:MAG: hypothetical protein AAGK74_01905 [Chloroflexota bacterium]
MLRMIFRLTAILFVPLAALLSVFSVGGRMVPQTQMEAMGYLHRACVGPCFMGLEVGTATGADVDVLRDQRRVALPHDPAGLASGATMNLTAPDVLNDPDAHIYLNFDSTDTIRLIGIRDTLCMTDVLAALGLPDDAIRHRNHSVVYSYWYGDESIWIFHSSSRSLNEIIEVQMFTFDHFRTGERYNLSQYTPYTLDPNDYWQGC